MRERGNDIGNVNILYPKTEKELYECTHTTYKTLLLECWTQLESLEKGAMKSKWVYSKHQTRWE